MRGGWSIPLFRLFGIRLELHLSFLLLLFFVLYRGYLLGGLFDALGFAFYLVLGFSCVVLHELGHSLTARHFGIPTFRILLLPIGGMAQLAEIPRRPRLEFFITIAGPAVNFALALLALALLALTDALPLLATALNGDPSGPRQAALNDAILSFGIHGTALVLFIWNVTMGLFNLLPVFPMDGGRILRSVLYSRLRNYLKATRLANWVSKPIYLLLLFYATISQAWLLVVLLLFVMLLGELEYRHVRQRERFADLAIGLCTARTFHCYPPNTTIAEALDIFQFHQPAELVLREKGRLLGIYTAPEVLSLAELHRLDTPLRDLVTAPSPLQAHWTLSMLGQQLERSAPRSYPVYQGDELIGVFRIADLDQLMDFHRARLRHRRPPETPFRPDSVQPPQVITRTRHTRAPLDSPTA